MHKNFRLGKWLIKPDTNEITSQDATRQLEHLVMQLLVFFAQNSGRDLGKEEILQGVWGSGVHNEEVLTVAVSSLRKALGDNPQTPEYIKTLHRFGYRMLQQPQPPENGISRERLSLFSELEQRIGIKFLVVAIIIALFLLVLLVQVAVELFVVVGR